MIRIYAEKECRNTIKTIQWDKDLIIKLVTGKEKRLANIAEAGQIATATFYLRNEGIYPYAITKVSFHDKRLGIKIDRGWLEPNDVAEIVVSFVVPDIVTPNDVIKEGSPFGTFAGGKFFGAQGVWIEDMDGTDAESYVLIDQIGITQNPPTMATIKVVSMVATNDRVLVCESQGTGSKLVKKDQYTTTSQSGDRDYIEVSGAIADDAPTSGVVRVVKDYGLPTEEEFIFNYTSIDRSGANDKFMISPNTTEAFDTDDRAYNPYIDGNADASGNKEITVKYSESTKYIVTIVRYKGYIPFSVAGSFAAAGITVTAIRTVDGIYQP